MVRHGCLLLVRGSFGPRVVANCLGGRGLTKLSRTPFAANDVETQMTVLRIRMPTCADRTENTRKTAKCNTFQLPRRSQAAGKKLLNLHILNY